MGAMSTWEARPTYTVSLPRSGSESLDPPTPTTNSPLVSFHEWLAVSLRAHAGASDRETRERERDSESDTEGDTQSVRESWCKLSAS